jgi:hypothetical protein
MFPVAATSWFRQGFHSMLFARGRQCAGFSSHPAFSPADSMSAKFDYFFHVWEKPL